jgi:hypothetical protein
MRPIVVSASKSGAVSPIVSVILQPPELNIVRQPLTFE